MKKFLTLLALVMAVSLCASAFAETAAEGSAAEAQAAEPTEEQLAEETEQALAACKALRTTRRVKDLETLKKELEAYVADGKLTQEQADLILSHYTEKLAFQGGVKGSRKQKDAAGESGQKRSDDPSSALEKTKPNGENRRQRNMNIQQKTEPTEPQSKDDAAAPDMDAASGATKKGR